MICDNNTSTNDGIKIDKYTRKWHGVPPVLIRIDFYCLQTKRTLILKSIEEEYKAEKAKILYTLENEEDKFVRSVKPKSMTGRKRNVQKAVDVAEKCCEFREILEYTQNTSLVR